MERGRTNPGEGGSTQGREDQPRGAGKRGGGVPGTKRKEGPQE